MDKDHAALLENFLLVGLARHGRKKFIEDCVKVYRANFNEEYIDHLKYVNKMRKKQLNKHGSTKDLEYRWGLSIPLRLHSILNRVLPEPKFLDDIREFRWFMRMYPEFRVPEQI